MAYRDLTIDIGKGIAINCVHIHPITIINKKNNKRKIWKNIVI